MQLSKIVELVQEIPMIDGKDHPAEAYLLEQLQEDTAANSQLAHVFIQRS